LSVFGISVHFKSDRQRRAIFASLGNRFSISSSGVSTGNGFADAIVNMYPGEKSASGLYSDKDYFGYSLVNEPIKGPSSIADAFVNLYPSSIQSSNGASNAIAKLYPGDDKKDDSLYTLYYPIDTFSEQEVLAAREEFDYPMAWIVVKEGNNYKMVLDPILVKKYYGGV
jgi:hypothetical protein